MEVMMASTMMAMLSTMTACHCSDLGNSTSSSKLMNVVTNSVNKHHFAANLLYPVQNTVILPHRFAQGDVANLVEHSIQITERG